MTTKIEYRVRPVTRYVITRFEQEVAENSAGGGKSTQCGEYDTQETAHAVAYALCKMEHEKSGNFIDSPDFIYPRDSM